MPEGMRLTNGNSIACCYLPKPVHQSLIGLLAAEHALEKINVAFQDLGNMPVRSPCASLNLAVLVQQAQHETGEERQDLPELVAVFVFKIERDRAI
jgi:hypothetical protein